MHGRLERVDRGGRGVDEPVGRPDIQSDHGSGFIGRDFAETLAEMRVTHTKIRPHTPTWEECTDPCQHAKCHMMSMKYAWSMYDGIEPTSCKKMWARTTVCDGYGDDIYASPGCGYHRTERGCYEWDWQSQSWVVSPNKGYGCRRRVEGYSYYACTPDECNNGWDDDHGGQFKKNRLDHVWHPGLYMKATGPPGGSIR